VLTGTAFFQSAIAFHMTTNLGLGYSALGQLVTVMTLFGLLTLPIWLKLARWIDKRKTAALSLFCYAVVTASWYFVERGDPQWTLHARGVLMGISASGLTLMLQSLLPDTIAYDTARTGENREGIYAGAYTFAEKIAYAIGAAITGIFLGLMGYISGAASTATAQPESALFAIALSASVIPSLLFLASIGFLYRYQLDEKLLATFEGQTVEPGLKTNGAI